MNFNWSFFILKMIFLIFYICDAKSNRNKTESFIVSTRIETSNIASYSKQGDINVKAEVPFNLRLIASQNLTVNGQISFTNVLKEAGENCNDLRRTGIFDLTSVDGEIGLVKVIFDRSDSLLDGDLKLCYREDIHSDWIHQGNSKMTSMKPVYQYQQLREILIIIKSLLIPFFLIISGLLSALALNLLSLTKSELRMLKNQGTSEEKKYSKVVTPLRRRGNVLFCSLLLINTLVNVIIAIIFHDLISYWSILAATLLIFFLGEIIPQTICSRFGILFGNKLAWLTNIIVVISLPFSYPVSKLLDWMLNDEVPMVYNRDRFQELLALNQRLVENNKNKSMEKSPENLKAWKLSNKTVGDVMLTLEDTFMLEYISVLDENTIKNIIKKGFTRVPVFKNTRSNVVALLHLNDLELIDPADLLTLKTVCKFYNRPVNFVFDDTKLDVILEEFKKGQSHMAMVQSINNEGPGDPYYETVGMLTLDDVITQVFQSDREAPIRNNQLAYESKIKCSSGESKIDGLRMGLYKLPCKQDDPNNLSNNQLTAIVAFLSQFPTFQTGILSPKILEKLLKQSQVIVCKDGVETEDEETQEKDNKKLIKSLDYVVIEKDKSMCCFVLVLEGRVLIEIGADNFVFTGKPFDHFGMPVLTNKLKCSHLHKRHTSTKIVGDQASTDYIPDFTVTPDPHTGVTCLIIDQSDYSTSVQASLLKRINEDPNHKSDNYLFQTSQNQATDADFVENAPVSQQQQVEQQMQQQQHDLQQQLQQQLEQELLQQQQLQQQHQSPYHHPNLFVNPSYIEENSQYNHPPSTHPTNAGNIITPSQSGHDGNDHKDENDDGLRSHGEDYNNDDAEDYKDGLIRKAVDDVDEESKIDDDT